MALVEVREPYGALLCSGGGQSVSLQGYLARKKTPTLLGPPQHPRHRPTVGFWGGAFSFKRGIPVTQKDATSKENEANCEAKEREATCTKKKLYILMPTAAVSNKLLKCKPNRKHVQFETLNSNNDPSLTFFFFFITREPRVVRRKSL